VSPTPERGRIATPEQQHAAGAPIRGTPAKRDRATPRPPCPAVAPVPTHPMLPVRGPGTASGPHPPTLVLWISVVGFRPGHDPSSTPGPGSPRRWRAARRRVSASCSPTRTSGPTIGIPAGGRSGPVAESGAGACRPSSATRRRYARARRTDHGRCCREPERPLRPQSIGPSVAATAVISAKGLSPPSAPVLDPRGPLDRRGRSAEPLSPRAKGRGSCARIGAQGLRRRPHRRCRGLAIGGGRHLGRPSPPGPTSAEGPSPPPAQTVVLASLTEVCRGWLQEHVLGLRLAAPRPKACARVGRPWLPGRRPFLRVAPTRPFVPRGRRPGRRQATRVVAATRRLPPPSPPASSSARDRRVSPTNLGRSTTSPPATRELDRDGYVAKPPGIVCLLLQVRARPMC